ncbi:MAG: ABC transporter substrate-binding protein [Bacteroidales bacterium]|nr:ABC transporter substrate-binding protein [Bacteroidales bacterium]
MKSIVIIIIFAYVLTTFLSCTSTTTDEICKHHENAGTLRYAESGNLSSLFPLTINNAASQRIVSLIHEGLVTLDPLTLSIKPGIADTWRVDTSEKEYRFFINTHVYFHDDPCFEKEKGRKLTIDDIIYSLTLLCTKSENNQAAESFIDQIEGAKDFYENKAKTIKGIIKENDSTLLIKLTKPNPMFLHFLASSSAVIFPKEAFEKYSKNLTTGVGPFYIKQFAEANKPMILCKNQKYFKTDANGNCLPYLDTIKIYFNLPIHEQLAWIKEGKLDVVMNVDNETFTNFLEQNIQMFEGKNASLKALSGSNFTSVQTQHIVKNTIQNIKINDINQIDFRETKFSTDTISAQK